MNEKILSTYLLYPIYEVDIRNIHSAGSVIRPVLVGLWQALGIPSPSPPLASSSRLMVPLSCVWYGVCMPRGCQRSVNPYLGCAAWNLVLTTGVLVRRADEAKGF